MRFTAIEIVRRLQDAGFEAFWVGGCVRDVLLAREPQDYDIATNARPEDTEKLFPKTIPVGRQFGVLLVVEGGHEFQIATFRAETDYKDGRRPERVSFSDAREDALRRDFTVNGLFFDPIANQLHDWVGGEADLRAKVVRTIGSPDERFAEDHLRLLRAIRFAAQLGFDIEPNTFAAVRKHAGKIRLVSAERIRDELIKLFSPPHAARGLTLLHESDLMPHVLPELVPTLTCEQSPDYHPEGSVFNHIRLMLDHLQPLPLRSGVPAERHPSTDGERAALCRDAATPDLNESLAWAAMLHDIAKPQTQSVGEDGAIHFYGHEKVGAEMAENILQRLKFPRKQTDEIIAAVQHHMQFKDAPSMRKATLRRMLLRETFPLELELHRLDCLGSHRRLDIYDFLGEQRAHLNDQPHLLPPLLTGNDLIALGLEPGPQLGALLHELRDKQLADELKNADEARAWVKEWMGHRSA
ncbi:MAG TPA: CCA tRNA nucleotidyltransferase [Methylomirabilota bacterium]|nr:CCA tRNA nucleotidyltransferase [Methylomirabilota bacterium]